MLQVIRALTIREYSLPSTKNVAFYEPVLYIPIKTFNFDESVREFPTHSAINHVKNFLTITALIYFFGFFFFLTPAMQICHLYGKKNWSKSLRPSRGPGWSKTQNGHDSVCLPYGQRHEESLKHKRLVLRPGIHPFDSLKLDALQRNTQGAHVLRHECHTRFQII